MSQPRLPVCPPGEAKLGCGNGSSQIRREWAHRALGGVYPAPELLQRQGMQNLPNEAGRDAPGALSLPFAALAQPKVVLLAAGLLGLAVDLFVRPLSWVGLALIVLATAPWMLQAWSQRSAPAATASRAPRAATGAPEIPARAEHRIASAGPRAEPARPQAASTVAREAPRPAAPTDPAARAPARPAGVPEPDPRTAAPRPPQARTVSPRSPEALAPARPVRPETAR